MPLNLIEANTLREISIEVSAWVSSVKREKVNEWSRREWSTLQTTKPNKWRRQFSSYADYLEQVNDQRIMLF